MGSNNVGSRGTTTAGRSGGSGPNVAGRGRPRRPNRHAGSPGGNTPASSCARKRPIRQSAKKQPIAPVIRIVDSAFEASCGSAWRKRECA